MSRENAPNPAYPDGLDGILDQMNARRAPLRFAPGEALPPLDCDLETLAQTRVKLPPSSTKARSDHARKSWEIAQELEGQNALLHLNGLLIAHLRKRTHPEHTAALFQRLWAEHADLLLRDMDLRWKVSSLTTFGDHGTTTAQRSAGMGLSTLFGMMKLYESERLFSGRDPDRPFTLDGRAKAPLPLEMNAFSLTDGGLDVNTLGRLWEEADKDDVIRPLAHDMLQRLIDDPGTVFRRLHRLRARKLRRMEQNATPDAAKAGITLDVPKDVAEPLTKTIKWGVVCTTNAPLLEVARFVAHHIDIGATHIYLFLDTPDPDVSGLLQGNPRVTVTTCDDQYWSGFGKARPEAHQLRQAFNATHALRQAKGVVDWLGHIDTDEFILSPKKLSTALKTVPDDSAAIRIFPAEALALPTEDAMPRHFKLSTTGPGIAKTAIHDVYPTFGSYVRGGFLSHLAGKVFARPGLGDVRLAIHRARVKGQDVVNTSVLDNVHIGHLHAPDWTTFVSKLTFRQTKGSYRVKDGQEAKSVGRLLAYLNDEEGEEGLRLFFEEICLDTPDLRTRLKRHNLLLTPRFDPNTSLQKVFGITLSD
ncbi:glycosyltransferase family 2 protein [Marivita sp. S6314]|uniref:glycosyltransferase family 2 protein n=1 Tax=Marivita sp. S6314 TaxID=2926406 RepID=UPI001FF5E1B7|nr:glycosyltransferase family 2 protein [Marivita sp. S6314]MCK0148742.1 glycosyltransferase family 2 protein [Marivita sp. S6314]